jgi:hypothetical protein
MVVTQTGEVSTVVTDEVTVKVSVFPSTTSVVVKISSVTVFVVVLVSQ